MQNLQTPRDGSPSQKPDRKFNIVRAEDDGTRIILGARWDVVTDPELSRGAKLLFVFLLDLALNPAVNKGLRGVITITTTRLCEYLTASARAIYRWKRELVEKRYIWITDHYVPNAWPFHTFHVTALDHPEQPLHMPANDSLWGNGARRQKVEPGPGARGLSGKKGHLGKPSKNAKLPGKSAGSGKNEHRPAAKIAAGSGNDDDGEPQSMPLGAAEVAAGSSKIEQRGAAKKDTGQPSEPSVLREGETGLEGELRHKGEGGKAPPPPGMPSFEPLDRSEFMGKRSKQGEKMIDLAKEKIFALEHARPPKPNAAAMIAAYKARIRDVKKWMAGEL